MVAVAMGEHGQLNLVRLNWDGLESLPERFHLAGVASVDHDGAPVLHDITSAHVEVDWVDANSHSWSPCAKSARQRQRERCASSERLVSDGDMGLS
jgi:hypothetical protein